MVDYSSQIIDAFKRKKESMCIHQISEESGVKEHSVSGLVYSLELRGDLVKCNEGQKATCKWFGGKHYFWSYAYKEEVEAKRSDEVGRMLRADHEKELKKLKNQHIDEITALKTALNIANLRSKQDSKATEVEVFREKVAILSRLLRVVLDEIDEL